MAPCSASACHMCPPGCDTLPAHIHICPPFSKKNLDKSENSCYTVAKIDRGASCHQYVRINAVQAVGPKGAVAEGGFFLQDCRAGRGE